MNILIISNIEGNIAAGLTYSVPKQVEAVSQFDNVYWLNLKEGLEEWKKLKYYHYKDRISLNFFDELPNPFNHPDAVILEQTYSFKAYPQLLFALKKSKIPYFIIPRSEFTKQAQNSKKMKKSISNLLFFNRFSNKAKGIIYLTESELYNSGTKWNKTTFVIPNGIEINEKIKLSNRGKKNISFSFIGRINIYQKGLDLLIEACEDIRDFLTCQNVAINIYGPDSNDKEKLRISIKKHNLENIILLKDSIWGEEKEQVLLNTDIFILTSRFEGLPMGVLQALSYGVPCLVTDGTYLKDKIEKFDAGWTCFANKGDIKNAIKRAINEIDKVNEKGLHAQKMAKSYEWYEIGRMTHSKIKECCRKE